MRPKRVWYVAYGSNVNETRFMRYLAGDAEHQGARNPTPPARNQWATVPLQLRFAGVSKRWGGGVCFVDRDPEAVAYVRAWDISSEQFEDVFAQENRRPVPSPLDWSSILTGDTTTGAGSYCRVIHVGLSQASRQQPALTFTWGSPKALNAPTNSYRDTIASALQDHPDLTSSQIAAYLP